MNTAMLICMIAALLIGVLALVSTISPRARHSFSVWWDRLMISLKPCNHNMRYSSKTLVGYSDGSVRAAPGCTCTRCMKSWHFVDL